MHTPVFSYGGVGCPNFVVHKSETQGKTVFEPSTESRSQESRTKKQKLQVSTELCPAPLSGFQATPMLALQNCNPKNHDIVTIIHIFSSRIPCSVLQNFVEIPYFFHFYHHLARIQFIHIHSYSFYSDACVLREDGGHEHPMHLGASLK